eukprot:COSAG01_NODE_1458_length_10252_cov_247.726288_1_plen_105_part_00
MQMTVMVMVTVIVMSGDGGDGGDGDGSMVATTRAVSTRLAMLTTASVCVTGTTFGDVACAHTLPLTLIICCGAVAASPGRYLEPNPPVCWVCAAGGCVYGCGWR